MRDRRGVDGLASRGTAPDHHLAGGPPGPPGRARRLRPRARLRRAVLDTGARTDIDRLAPAPTGALGRGGTRAGGLRRAVPLARRRYGSWCAQPPVTDLGSPRALPLRPPGGGRAVGGLPPGASPGGPRAPPAAGVVPSDAHRAARSAHRRPHQHHTSRSAHRATRPHPIPTITRPPNQHHHPIQTPRTMTPPRPNSHPHTRPSTSPPTQQIRQAHICGFPSGEPAARRRRAVP